MKINPISINYTKQQYSLEKRNLPQKTVNDVFEKNNILCFKGNLIKKYNLDVSDIEVKSIEPVNLTDEQKELLLCKIIEAHELAKKNVETRNIVKKGYATNVCSSDGTWHLATNFNNTRNEISAICGERSAIIIAYNRFLQKLLKTNDTKTTQNDFKIKYLAMASSKEIGTDKNAASSCADCLSWYNTTRYFDNDTKIVFLTKDETNGKYILEIKTLKEVLPMRGEDKVNSVSLNNNISFAPFVISDDAKRIMEEKIIKEDDIQEALKRAQEVCKNPISFTPYLKQKVSACVKVGDKYYCAPKINWSKRWFLEPVEFAIAKSTEENGPNQAPDIIAYFASNEAELDDTTEQDEIISIKTIGRIKSLNKNAEPIIAFVNQNNEIEVCSINDFMPKQTTFVQQYIK